jgi:hypothetical protein
LRAAAGEREGDLLSGSATTGIASMRSLTYRRMDDAVQRRPDERPERQALLTGTGNTVAAIGAVR